MNHMTEEELRKEIQLLTQQEQIATIELGRVQGAKQFAEAMLQKLTDPEPEGETDNGSDSIPKS